MYFQQFSWVCHIFVMTACVCVVSNDLPSLLLLCLLTPALPHMLSGFHDLYYSHKTHHVVVT